MVAEALEWVRGLTPGEDEDYLYNLWVITRGESVREDRLGLACSLMAAHRRHLEGERKKAEAAERPQSEYVGEPGKRATFLDCTLRFVGEPMPSDFGPSTYMLFLKDGKDAIVWYMSGSPNPADWEVGQVYDLVGTVKRHEIKVDRKFGTESKRTIINRARKANDKEIAKQKKAATSAAK
jgi:hypothetical protein